MENVPSPSEGVAEPVITPHADEVIASLLEYRAAEQAMSVRTRDALHMGTRDLQALRFLIKAESEQRIVSGRVLADHLGMTSASVTALLDRLTKSGHVQRTPHPTNRRSNMVTATVGSEDEVRQTLGGMHARMIDAVKALGPEDAALVREFLESMTAAVDSVDVVNAT
ncbi:MarR family winged helix-turn-helix transcriptional regulator [Cryobacterium sp. PAMC25264]|uniref:MarR family winged helix-turn-helix transcriptional regulator n=1 Tax=Cryobacterium sp. PAMC25264 TaxID=2861288 RepID=UPI001C62E608|nr:MarR family transcriptional regulator [Cryobacterium sp. PAMC25264]QYF73157.1 MarR family transcriptional regulator [Cryobacterium sp. PAMC25264]